MYEPELVEECLEGVRAALPAGAELELRQEEVPPRDTNLDGQLHIRGPWGQLEIPLEANRRVTAATVALMNQRLQDYGVTHQAHAPAWILFTEYVNGRQARQLKEDGIAFADTRGNVHLWGPGLYVWVVGNRPKARVAKAHRLTRPAAARVLFVLLQDPGRAREPYRDLAALAGVAPDTVNRVFKDLEEKGFLRVWGERERELTRLRELHELWTVAYEDALYPKLRPKRYQWKAGDPVTELVEALILEPMEPPVLLGGEAAAAALTEAIRPATATIHAHAGERRTVMKALGLVPHPDGAVTLLDTFGTTNGWPEPGRFPTRYADPLLIHAELVRAGDDRAMAVAGDIYEQFIMDRFARA